MKRTAVDSSMLASAGYDPTSQTLEVEFNTGRVYQYFDLPQSEYDGLMAADSLGSYFYHNIRDSYRYQKVR